MSLQHVLRAHGLSLDTLSSSSSALILFGSQTLGAGADWDLLAIGSGTTIRDSSLDLLWVSANKALDPSWLQSELATHIASYGRVLSGTAPWFNSARVTEKTVERKRKAVQARLHAVRRLLSHFGPRSRSRYQDLLRRDIQRLVGLQEGLPVPPRPTLDQDWHATPDWAHWAQRARLTDPDTEILKTLFVG